MCKKKQSSGFIQNLLQQALQAETIDLRINNLDELKDALAQQVSNIYEIFMDLPSLKTEFDIQYIYNRVDGQLGALCELFLTELKRKAMTVDDELVDNARMVALTRSRVLLVFKNDVLREKVKRQQRESFRIYFPVFLGIIGSLISALIGAVVGAWATLFASNITTWPFS